ncbi:hypothetical protein FOZ63_023863, partial [Perkinsus olseni]
GWQREDALQVSATLLDVAESSLARWSRDYEVTLEVAESAKGKHGKVISPITSPDYCDFRDDLREYVKERALGGSGKNRLTVAAAAEWVNSRLGLEGDATYSERTVGLWMHYLGFKLHTVKKTLYVDGHERPDVVADRARLAEELAGVDAELMRSEDGTL